MSLNSSDEIRKQKQAVRKEVRSRIREMSAETVSKQSEDVWERLFALDVYKEANSVGLFLSMPNWELKTDTALVNALTSDKTVYIPQVGQNFENYDMELMRVFVDNDKNANDKIFHHDWPRNKWGIPEPPESMPREAAKPGDIDVIIMPGLAFDKTGARLGQGKGYYDRFIARMRETSAKESKTLTQPKKPLLVAVAMEPQIVESIPVAEYDFYMDMLITPSATMSFSRS